MPRRLLSTSARVHSILAVAGLLAVVAAGMQSGSQYSAAVATPNETIDIAVEHTEPVSLRLDISILKGQALIDISHDSSETIKISLPTEWQRGEVRGAPLKDFTAEAPMLGFKRWQLPPQTGVTFQAYQAPEGIMIHNPSRERLKITFTRVDLETEEVLYNVKLVQEGAIRLW